MAKIYNFANYYNKKYDIPTVEVVVSGLLSDWEYASILVTYPFVYTQICFEIYKGLLKALILNDGTLSIERE